MWFRWNPHLLGSFNVLAPLMMVIQLALWFLLTLQGWITMAVVFMLMLVLGQCSAGADRTAAFRYQHNPSISRADDQIMQDLAREHELRVREYWSTR
jgi:hypothetical protein